MPKNSKNPMFDGDIEGLLSDIEECIENASYKYESLGGALEEMQDFITDLGVAIEDAETQLGELRSILEARKEKKSEHSA